MTSPLIVAAHLDEASFEVFDGLRRRHFPSQLNKIPAHLSLFHQLPGCEFEAIVAQIGKRCHGMARVKMEPAGVRFLGRGVALAYQSAEITRLHDQLASEWRHWLIPQDRQPFKAHITIQNKVEPATARTLFANLQGLEMPPCGVEGISVWRYLGGPWRHLVTCRFGSP